jgi:hypothetical protein
MNEEVQQRREFTSDEVQAEFDKVDEHFAKKEEAENICPECRGMDGHHYTNCTKKNEELPPALEQSSTPGEPLPGKIQTPEEQLSHVKLPPTPEMLAGSDILWLIARTCHEVNRAYCVGVTSDHSHQPWDEAPEWQRESCYEGVLKHYENPEFTPEDSHKSWSAKKIDDGWVFGNMKDETARTHPNLVPYHTLHIHERTKDELFSAICKSMLGGLR